MRTDSDPIDSRLLAERLDGVCQRLDDIKETVRTYAPTATQVAVIQSELTDVRDDIKTLRGDVEKLEESRNSTVKLVGTAIGTAIVAYVGAKLTGQGPA